MLKWAYPPLRSVLYRDMQCKWVSFPQEIKRHGSQFGQGKKTLEVGPISQ